MLTWIVLVFSLWSSASAIGVPHYECGEHGRFEYCIDGIPGCVVGCHCHPGYYFDSETKICEPNAKLVHEYRRLYEPTLAPPLTPRDSGDAETEPPPTTTTDQTIAKEADELGNWLYNQFFKTIENKVINETDKTPEKPTRRSQGKSLNVLTRRSNRKKSRRRKSGLRKRLLRITEDDSLFDSDESDDSSSSSTDSSESSDTSSSGETMNEEYIPPAQSHKKKDDEEHGHRKILMMNKKPKPPLPSFIFLPNFETPFYPPIGLPPPPALPMYPMVPVPPMIPMPCASSTSTSKPSTKTSTAASTAETTSSPPPSSPPPPPPPPPPPVVPPEEENQFLRHHGRGERNGMISPMRLQSFRGHHRRNKLHNEEPWGDKINTELSESPPLNDVDFKYLTQLIHKAGLNPNHKSKKLPKSPPTRRNDYELQDNEVKYMKNRRLQEDPEQAYYSNLGQKIASLIRKVDANQGHPSDSESPAHNMKSVPIQQNSVFQTQNSYSPRSYWERFVRSPMQQLRAFGDVFPPENYENLFNIESKVETVADTQKPLSLGELENALVLMNKAKLQFQNTIEDDASYKSSDSEHMSDGGWNVNLLMPNFKTTQNTPTQSTLKTTEKPVRSILENRRNIEQQPHYQKYTAPKTLTRNNTRTLDAYVNSFSNIRGILMQNFRNIANDTRTLKNYTIPSRRSQHFHSSPRRSGRVEPTDHQGTFIYPKQVEQERSVHKAHLVPVMKPLRQYSQFKTLSVGQPTYYQPQYPGFFSDNNDDDARQYVVQRTMNSLQSPPGTVHKSRPTSFFDQLQEFGDFD